MADNKQRQTSKFLYVYTKHLPDGKVRRYWWKLNSTEAMNDGSPIDFDLTSTSCKIFGNKKPWVSGLRPGAIVVIEEDENSVYYGNILLIDHWKCHDQVVEWNAVESAGQLAADARKRNAVKDIDLSALDPIRNAYWSLSGRDRKALMVRVLSYLESGK